MDRENAQELLLPGAGSRLQLLPRLIRLRDAPGYLGMDRNKFNAEVRPFLTEIPLGKQAVAFDRLELDGWVDDYISRNGRRPKAFRPEDDICLNATVCRDSASRATYGRSRNAVKSAKADGSAKARERLAALRRKSSLSAASRK
jgi:hypothetical protein